MKVSGRIDANLDRLSAAEQRVAHVVAHDPPAVAFGTVAAVARLAGTSGPTVLRLARRLGYGGFTDLQAAVRADLAERLSPAARRIGRPPAAAPLAEVLAADVANVEATLADVDPAAFADAVTALSSAASVVVVAADELRGVAGELATQLSALRPGVVPAGGTTVAVGRAVGALAPGDVLVAMDVRRYERAVVGAVRQGAARRAAVLALSDSRLSPLAGPARWHIAVRAAGIGPFDSHVGFLSAANALLAGVAGALRRPAARRLRAAEAAWADLDVFV